MPTRNINLTGHLDRFVEDVVASGRFGNASEVMREALRLLEQREREDQARLEWLRAAVREGVDALDQGEYITLRSRQEIRDFIRQRREEVSDGLAAEPDRG